MGRLQLACTCGHVVSAEVTAAEPNGGNRGTGRPTAVVPVAVVCPACAGGQPRPAAVDSQMGLAPLTGSAYQVAWARDIRASHLKAFRRLLEHCDPDAAASMWADMVRLVNQQTRAGWWIEYKDNTFYGFLPVVGSNVRKWIIECAFSTAHPVGSRSRQNDTQRGFLENWQIWRRNRKPQKGPNRDEATLACAKVDLLSGLSRTSAR
ncbi:MAG: hypothetical protein K6T78_04215 [Alicyclobacillus sp.]|nr:hypothetical protein [Alicyclobacillus sp.]